MGGIRQLPGLVLARPRRVRRVVVEQEDALPLSLQRTRRCGMLGLGRLWLVLWRWRGCTIALWPKPWCGLEMFS